MRIGIDARWIFASRSGVGIYTCELIRQLAVLDQANDYVLFFQNAGLLERTAAETGFRQNPRFTAQLVDYGVFSIPSQLRLPKLLRRLTLDVFHSTNYMIPLLAFPRRRRGGAACVVTIHDVIPLIFPDHAPKSRKSRLFPVYRRLMIEVGRRADRILTVTEASRTDILRHLRLPPAAATRVHAIYNGVAPAFTPDPAGRPRSTDPNRPRRLLYVGRADPYKNLPVLIRAFDLLRKSAPFPVSLQLVGARDPRYPEAAQLAQACGAAANIEWLEALPQDRLAGLYRAADLVALPSRYEGFGLPVAEAMACGTPVVCGDCGALREVAGDAALFIASDDVEGLARSMRDVLTDAALADGLARRGRARAPRFDWRLTAEQTLEIYRHARQND